MKMKNIIAAFLLIFISSATRAQVATDALRYAQLQLGSGSARTMGVGGSIGALGADFSTLSTNPAGLASFRRSEFSFSPGYFTNTTTSTMVSKENIGIETDANKFTLNSWGFVFTHRPNNGNGNWKTVNIAIGKNRLANLDEEFSFEGRTKGSLAESMLERAQGLAPNKLDGFSTRLAYESGAIYNPNPNGNVKEYTNDFQDNAANTLVKKSQYVLNEGKITEFVLSMAGNYKEKVQVGGTIAFPRAVFNSIKDYREADAERENPYFNSLSFKDSLAVSTPAGKSITAKLGVIYKVSQALRVGVALHSPTSWNIQEAYKNSMTYGYTEKTVDAVGNAESPDGSYNYKIVTPARIIGSLAYLVGQKGFLSAEVEYIDYTQMRFKFSDIGDKPYETTLNNNIKNQFKPAINARVGAEAVLGVLRLRGGVGLYSNPLLADNSIAKIYTGGVGFREDNFYVDLAAQFGSTKTGYTPYSTTSGTPQQINNASKTASYVMTFGVKF
jgi:hypothetical protein